MKKIAKILLNQTKRAVANFKNFNLKVKISELRMEILDKKSNRMSRANAGVSECNEFPNLQRILDFLSLRNLLSNELFLLFIILQQPLIFYKVCFIL